MHAPIALMVLSHRRIVQCNKALAELFGWTREQLIGQTTRVLYPSEFDYETIGKRWMRWLKNRSSYQDERFMQTSAGEIFWARARGRTLTPEDPFALMVWTLERLAEDRADANILSLREREVAQHIVNGRTCKEIGALLGISHRTVEAHRAAIKRKLNVKNTAELVSKIIVIR